jgi:uncharacterized protein
VDVALVLTHDCNLGCPYCYAGKKFRKPMSREIAERALDFAVYDKAQKIQISFFGGEPFLTFDLLEEYTLLAKQKLEGDGRKLKFVVTTNGTGFNKKRLDFLKEHDFFVGLSIDGVAEAQNATRPFTAHGRRFGDPGVVGHDSFDVVYDGLRQLMAAGLDFETITVVDPGNVAHLGKTVRFLLQAGVRRISLNPNFAGEWSDEDLALWEAGYRDIAQAYLECYRRGHLAYINVIDDKVITHLKGGYRTWDHCELGKGAIAVAPSGNIYPCERMVSEDADHTYVIGTVFDGLTPRRTCLIEMSGNHNDDCGGCALTERCMSWCACANISETGSLNIPGGLVCWHEQTAIDVADTVAAQLYREQNPMFLQHYYLR